MIQSTLPLLTNCTAGSTDSLPQNCNLSITVKNSGDLFSGLLFFTAKHHNTTGVILNITAMHMCTHVCMHTHMHRAVLSYQANGAENGRAQKIKAQEKSCGVRASIMLNARSYFINGPGTGLTAKR